MVILNIAGLSNKKFAGPNINVPTSVLYEEKIVTAGLYNTGEENLDNVKKLKFFFKKDEMKNYNIKTLPKPFDKPDLVIFNSMYIWQHVNIAKKLNNANIPYIIIPRGALTRNAQQKKWYKKEIANILIFNQYIKRAKAIQFLTENERKESYKFKYCNCIVSGNGTERKNEIKQYKKINKEFIITFIGRIERFHKGLDVLVEAVNIGQDELRKNHIVFNLYGPDDNGSIKILKKYINNHKISDLIKFEKPVFDEEKKKILLNSDLFIHTSRLEGHPTAVIEAISYGIPVLVTPGTNVDEDVKNNNLGFVSELNPFELYKTIMKAYNKKSEFKQITQNEISFSRKKLEWEAIIERTIKEYKNILGIK